MVTSGVWANPLSHRALHGARSWSAESGRRRRWVPLFEMTDRSGGIVGCSPVCEAIVCCTFVMYNQQPLACEGVSGGILGCDEVFDLCYLSCVWLRRSERAADGLAAIAGTHASADLAGSGSPCATCRQAGGRHRRE